MLVAEGNPSSGRDFPPERVCPGLHTQSANTCRRDPAFPTSEGAYHLDIYKPSNLDDDKYYPATVNRNRSHLLQLTLNATFPKHYNYGYPHNNVAVW